MEKFVSAISKTTWQMVIFLIACVMFFFSCGYYNIPLFAWIYPLLLLFFYRNTKSKPAVIVATIIFAAVCYFKYIGLLGSTLGDIIIAAITFIIPIIPLLLDRWLYKPIKNRFGTLAIFIFPVIYAALSTFEKADIGLGRMLSFTQAEFDSLIQSVSVIGSSGLILIMCLFCTTVLYCFEKYTENKPWKRPLIVYFCVISLIIVGGSINIAVNKTLGEDVVKVGMTQTSQDVDFDEEEDLTDLETDIEYIKDQAERAANGEAAIVCYGEEAFYITAEEKETLLTETCKIAKQNNIYMAVPIEVDPPEDSDEEKALDEMYLFSNAGEIIGHYIKTNLMPELEDQDYVKGDNDILFREISYGEDQAFNASFVLCYDVDLQLYPTLCSNDTEVLFVPSWGWDINNPYHTNVMRIRAIELGVPIVNPSISVKSATVDWMGQTIAVSDADTTGFDYVTFADVPISHNHSGTIYKALAPYIMWGLIAFSIILVIMGLVLKIKKS